MHELNSASVTKRLRMKSRRLEIFEVDDSRQTLVKPRTTLLASSLPNSTVRQETAAAHVVRLEERAINVSQRHQHHCYLHRRRLYGL
jgi:hypothetical protein